MPIVAPSPRRLAPLAFAVLCVLALAAAACTEAPPPSEHATAEPPAGLLGKKAAAPVSAAGAPASAPLAAGTDADATAELGAGGDASSSTSAALDEGLGRRGRDHAMVQSLDPRTDALRSLVGREGLGGTGKVGTGASGIGGLGAGGLGAGGGGLVLGGSVGLGSAGGSAGRSSRGAIGKGTGTTLGMETGVGSGYGYGAAGVALRASGSTRAAEPAPPPQPGGTFAHAGTNPIVDVREDPFSTFAIDVDTGSWLYARRFLRMGRTPTAASVRVEEWVNGLHYAYRAPAHGDAFAIHVDAAPSPFTRDRHVVRVAIQGRRVEDQERKPAHLTFLVDVSGSMQAPDKLPWAQQAMHEATNALRDDDSVAIVTYAGSTGVVLPATSARVKQRIHEAIDGLRPGGGTDMGSGMELSYREANKHLASERTSRVIVLSDGDANIGRTSHGEILKSIRGYVSEGVTLSTVGFGTGNYNDHLMEQLADAGNGNYAYIDSKETMKRVFVDELTSTLEVIAADVKVQVEWNPEAVRTYRLLGYENRDVADRDFRDDKKDAGEIGAGHAVTALYEVELVDAESGKDLGTVHVRHKVPRHPTATETSLAITRTFVHRDVKDLDADAKAALGMALGAEILRGSEHAAGLTLVDAARLLRAGAAGAHAAERREVAALFEKAPAQAMARR